MDKQIAYSRTNSYQRELEYQQDLERICQLYPSEAKLLRIRIEDVCDKMEYEGSLMFEEYPDRIGLHMIAKKIYDQMYAPQEKRDNNLLNLVEIMLYQEIYLRRCRRRRCGIVV